MNNLEELKKKYEELGEEIKRLECKKENKSWRAEHKGDFYFYINSCCDITDCHEAYDVFDNNRYKLGNYFEHPEMAQNIANKIETYIELKQLAEELNGDEEIDWKDVNQDKYYIWFDYDRNDLTWSITNDAKDIGQIYCLSANFMEKALEQIGKERLVTLFE